MSYQPRVLSVADGGTGLATQTAHALYVGNAASAPNPVSVGATGTVLAGVTGADPVFTATPTVTSISFGGTTLSNYSEGTFTPTMVGTVAGTTTYTNQFGYYRRIGNLVVAQANITGSAATGTGNIVFGALPFTIKNQSNGVPIGSMLDSNFATWAYPASTTSPSLQGIINSLTATCFVSGSATTGGVLQMANAAFNFQYTLSYEV